MGELKLPNGTVYRTGDKADAAKSAEPGPLSKEVGRRAAAEYRKLTMKQENASVIAALEKAAADWRQRALDGRVNGLDHEVRALYVRKAEAAEKEARRLSGEELQEQIDLTRAMDLEAEAVRHDRKAGDMSLPLDVRRYYRDKAIECRNLAAIHRGEKPLGEPPADTVGRSVTVNLPR